MCVFPIGRMGRPEELVAAVRYLCSDDARYVTGSMLILDGGYTAQWRSLLKLGQSGRIEITEAQAGQRTRRLTAEVPAKQY